jgi:hypothetical protein
MNTSNNFNSFEEIVAAAQAKITSCGRNYTLSFSETYQFPVELLREPQLLDVVDKARAWQSTVRPPSLYFSHGEYIGDRGPEHVAAELIKKHNSNRALISLISQKDIIDSGDRPIPSFLIYQCAIDGDVLFVTVYFRALELSKFLRINLEEIRLITYRVYSQTLAFKTVRLNILAFRAYVEPTMNTLEKCKLDQLDEINLLKIVEKSPAQLPELIREKGVHATVISLTPLTCLRRIFASAELEGDIPFKFNRARYLSLLDRVIRAGGELAVLRTKVSHHPDATDKATEFRNLIEEFAREVEECLSH